MRTTLKMNRAILRNTIDLFSYILPFGLLKSIKGNLPLCVFYHVVSDDNLAHVKHLYRYKTSKEFSDDLEFFKKNYNTISVDELFQSIENDSPLAPDSVLITFDDGLRECYEVIAPLLKKYDCPACFFLNSAFIDNNDLMFRYKASLLIEYFVEHPVPKNIFDLFHTYDLVYKSPSNLLDITYNKRSLLDKLALQIDFDFKEFCLSKQPYMNTAQIQGLIEDGFDIGAHSIDHPLYYQINMEEQLRQTIQSCDFIQNKFELDKRLFAFPFTDYKLSQNLIDQLTTEHEIKCLFGGAGLKKEKNHKHIQRLALEEKKYRHVKQILKSELVYYFLKGLFNKNQMKRHEN